MDKIKWESCFRFILKLLQFFTSAFLIFSLYNIGPNWILLVACLAVPIYGMYLMASSPNRTLRHPLPYIRYKASMQNKSWLKVDCIICATMSFVCFGFSTILFFGYFKMDLAASFLVKGAVISLMLSIFYMFNALISAKQMQDDSFDFIRMERQPFSTHNSHQSPLTLSPVFDDSYKSNKNGISLSRHRVAPMIFENGNNNYYEQPNQQSEMVTGNKKQSVDFSLHKTSIDTHSSASPPEAMLTSRRNLPAKSNLWPLNNGNGQENVNNDRKFSNNGFNNISNYGREIPSHVITGTTTFRKKFSLTNEIPSTKKISLGEDSTSKNHKSSLKRGSETGLPVETNGCNKYANNRHVSCLTASVLDVTINGQTTARPIFDDDVNRRKKSLPILTTSPTSYSTYKTNTEPYNRRAMLPENSARSSSATELRVTDNLGENHYATPLPVLHSKSYQLGAANNKELLTNVQKQQYSNRQLTFNAPIENESQDVSGQETLQFSSFLPRYTFSNSSHQYSGVNLYSGIQRAIPVSVTPAKLKESNLDRNKGSPRFSDSANSSSPDYSASVGSVAGEPISSSRSTIRVDALGQSPEWANSTTITKINVNTGPILTTIATAIDSSRENQIREKKLKRRQHCQSETSEDFDVMIRPRTASFRQSTELNIARGCGGISPRQITDF